LHYIADIGIDSGTHCVKVGLLEVIPILSAKKCSANNLVFRNIRFILTFWEITETECEIRQQKNQQYSGGATPGCARSNDLAGRSTALAPPCLLRPVF